MSVSSLHPFLVATGACETHLPAEIIYKLFSTHYIMFLQCCKNAVRRGVFSKQKTGLGRGRSRDSRTPQNPDFGPAKKSSLPPAKMCKKWGFWAKKRAF